VLPDFDVLGLSIKTFGLFFGLSFVLCGLVVARRLRETGRPPDWAYEMVLAALIGGLIGARAWWAVDHLDEV
jgi:phosphatidylglycerol:prolipoprotein diacylglycerol transferase